MEKKLHPLFYGGERNNVAGQFDPTPQSMVRNFIGEKTESKMPSEQSNEIQFRLNRVTHKVSNLEERIQNVENEVRAVYAQHSGKIKECMLRDHKIEALIERHNQLVNSFEKRLTQATKLFEESQVQLLSTQAALDEARREIIKLKSQK